MKYLIAVANGALASRIAARLRYAAAEIIPLASLVTRAPGEDGLIIADEQGLGALATVNTRAQVLCVSEGSVSDNVLCLSRFPSVSQLVTPALFDSQGGARLLFGLMREHDTVDVDTMAFLGTRRLHARRVLLYRSRDLEPRLDRVAELAGQWGGRARGLEALREIGHELLANAFYDAPFEAGLSAGPAARRAEVQLPPDRPCEVIYGAVNDELFLRVRDCFGALGRERLFEVLGRCAGSASQVPLDESRGGAGLGLWTVFRKASRIVISVAPTISTEVLVTVPMAGVTRGTMRAWHLLFPGART